MPEEHDERAGYGERDDFDDVDDLADDEFDDVDEPDDFDDDDDGPGRHWPAPGYPPGAPGEPPGGWHRGGPWGGGAARRGWLLALTAVVAAAFGFGVVVVALHEAAGPASAGAAPSSSATASPGAVSPKTGAGNGTQPAPQGGLPSLPPGAMERLEIGGQVTAVSATSITLNGGGQEITATVTRATKVTGKVTSISGVKVGDFVSASISGANGKLTAGSIQDPASLPSGSGQ